MNSTQVALHSYTDLNGVMNALPKQVEIKPFSFLYTKSLTAGKGRPGHTEEFTVSQQCTIKHFYSLQSVVMRNCTIGVFTLKELRNTGTV